MSAKEYDEALARLIEVIKAHSAYALEKQGFHTLASTLRIFLAASDVNEANKICEQINTLLPMNRINAVGQAFIKGTLQKNCTRLDLLSVIANFEIGRLIEVHDLIYELDSLSFGPCGIGRGILDVENRSHEEMTERLEQTEEIKESNSIPEPAFVYAITLKQHPSSKWLNWRSFFSESRYRQSNIGKIRLTTSLEHYDGLNELYNDPDVTEVHKWFGLHKSVSKAERSNLHLLCILPEAWSYIQGIKDSEPLWSNIDHAQQAMSELAKLAPKNAKSDSEEKSENLVDNDRL